jgi:hypothetical protein
MVIYYLLESTFIFFSLYFPHRSQSQSSIYSNNMVRGSIDLTTSFLLLLVASRRVIAPSSRRFVASRRVVAAAEKILPSCRLYT